MNTIRNKTFLTGLSSLALVASLPAAIIVDHTFDGLANDNGELTFQQVANGLGGGSSDLSTGLVTTGNSIGAGIPNSNYGFNTTSSIDLSAATGFTMTFYVSGTSVTVSDLGYNGLFFGAVSGTNANDTGGSSLWTNNPHSIGYVAGSGNYGDNEMRQDAEGGGGNDANSVTTALGGTAPTNASFQDGFTVTVGLFDDDTWTVSSTGLSTNLNGSGSLTTTGAGMLNYNAIATNLTPYVSLQGEVNGTINVDRIAINTVPEPSSTALLGLGGLALILRRRRA
jgi:hypothetical protein